MGVVGAGEGKGSPGPSYKFPPPLVSLSNKVNISFLIKEFMLL